MRREIAQRRGFRVRPELSFVSWNPLQRSAGLFHFFVKFEQQRFADSHERAVS
jgi:hypothetical protein